MSSIGTPILLALDEHAALNEWALNIVVSIPEIFSKSFSQPAMVDFATSLS